MHLVQRHGRLPNVSKNLQPSTGILPHLVKDQGQAIHDTQLAAPQHPEIPAKCGEQESNSALQQPNGWRR
jgi:hypothetical protein